MLLMFVFVVMISFAMFFRDDLARLINRLDNIPYFFNVVIAFSLTHLMFSNYDAMGSFLVMMQYHLNIMLAWLYSFFISWMSQEMAEFCTKSLIKLSVISTLVFYPYYYKNKYKSIIYAEQVDTINMTFIYCLLVVMNIFVVFDL